MLSFYSVPRSLMIIIIFYHSITSFADEKKINTISSDLSPFKRSYLLLEFANNYPQAKAQERYQGGPAHPIFGYRYTLGENWLLGLGGQFKIFERREKKISRELALWSIYHQTLYTIRLYHPNYLLIGPKLLYLLPAKSAKLPLQKDESNNIEMGAAISVVFAHVVDNKIITLRVDRWRGTATTRIQGLEVALGINIAVL